MLLPRGLPLPWIFNFVTFVAASSIQIFYEKKQPREHQAEGLRIVDIQKYDDYTHEYDYLTDLAAGARHLEKSRERIHHDCV